MSWYRTSGTTASSITGTTGQAVECGGRAAPAGKPQTDVIQAVELGGCTAWAVVPRLAGGTTARFDSSFLPSVSLLPLILPLIHFDQ